MAAQDTPEIQALSREWLRLQAAGASQDVLDKIHARAQELRLEQGYLTDAGGDNVIWEKGNTTSSIKAIEPIQIIENSIDPSKKTSNNTNNDILGNYDIDGEKLLKYAGLIFGAVILVDKLFK